MAANEGQLSPEEKLLRVIQNGRAQEDEAPAWTPETDQMSMSSESGLPPEGVADEVATLPLPALAPGPPVPPKVKPRLQIAAEEQGPEAEAVSALIPEMAMNPAAAPVRDIVAAERSRGGRGASRKKKRDRGRGITVVNRCLVAAALIFLVFTVLEIWASVRSVRDDRAIGTSPEPGVFGEVPAVESPPVLPSLDVILKPFIARSLFDLPDSPKPKGIDPNPDEPRLRESLALIGLSKAGPGGTVFEAIVVDKKDQKMHFLTVGDSIAVDGISIKLEEIHADRVVFSSGDAKIRITVE